MRIAIWGYGEIGKKIRGIIPKEHSFVYYIDSAPEKINNITIMSPDTAYKDYKLKYDVILVAVINQTYIREIAILLCENDIYDVGFLGDDATWNSVTWVYSNKPFLQYLEVNVIDNCNLKCKGCTHFSNLFHDKSVMPLYQFTNSLKIINDKFFLKKLRLLGGEPLLLDNLHEYIHNCREIFPDTDIRVVTNGLRIMQLKDIVLNELRECNIIMDISNYPPTQRKINDISNFLEKHGIKYNISTPIDEFYRVINLNGDSDSFKAYEWCRQKYCACLRDGILYSCPFEAIIYKFKEYFNINCIDSKKINGLVLDDTLSAIDIMKKLYRQNSLCMYCSEKGDFFRWSTSSNPEMEEWIAKYVK